MLRPFRKMGSMEQIFTVFNDLKIRAWGPAAGVSVISGLSEIPLEKLQFLWNQMHEKYQSFQCQILTVASENEYDELYIGCLPFQIIKYDQVDVDEIVLREINHRYLLLNDFGLKSPQDIANGNYDIKEIAPLYRLFVCKDNWFLNYNHAIADGMSMFAIFRDWMALLNDDKFIPKMIPYVPIEDCIDPKYAKPAISRKIENFIPTYWAVRFAKFYANNWFCKKYNPLGMHRDDLLRFQFYFDKNILAFPLDGKFNRYDYDLGYRKIILAKSTTKNIVKQCKLHKVHVSSLFQYIASAAIIECHDNELKDDYYKTMVNNVFSTIPMYKDQNKIYLGIHASAYHTMIDYYRNVKIGSDKFWQIIAKIDEQVLNDDMVAKVFQNKFPFMNLKKFWGYALEDKYKVFERSMGAPTVTNPGVMDINKEHYKHKVIRSWGGANPGVGMGAAYILGGTTIKGIYEMTLGLCYGKQHLSDKVAQKMLNKIKQKLEIIGSARTNYQSKL